MGEPFFGADLFDFLRELAAHNDRDWFQANRDRYRTVVLEPLQRFVEAFAPRLARISPHYVADPRPQGGSIFRIYRDVRFSRDKSPYKTHAAAQFRHVRRRDVHAPGFYLHLEPGNVFAGAGMWHPPGPALRAVREAIVARPGEWEAVLEDPVFAGRLRLGGGSLKRAPRGFDPEHPLIDHLRRTDFVCFADLTEADAMSQDFLDRFTDVCQAAAPFVRFLAGAVGLEF